MKKYTKKFEADYNFYLRNSSRFTFCGREIPCEYSEEGVSAKEAFYQFDTKGKRVATCEPEEYKKVMSCKAALNLAIKMWAEGFIDVGQTIDEYFEDIIIPFNYNIIWLKKAFINQICKIHPSVNKDKLLLTLDNVWKKKFLQRKHIRIKV